MNRRLFFTSLFLPLVLLPASAPACAVCMGDPNSYLAGASNGVIWMLLGLVGFIFTSTGATGYYLWRHSKKEIPPHVQLIEKLGNESGEPDNPDEP